MTTFQKPVETPTRSPAGFPGIASILARIIVPPEDEKPPNGGVDAAVRIQSSIAGPVTMRNTPPPLASNDLFGVVARGVEKAKSNSPGCESKAKQTEHKEDARTPYKSTAWIEAPILL